MTPRTVSAVSTFSLLAIVATALPGCGGSNGTPGNNALAPQFEPQVVNSTDDFQFQATGMTGVTQTLNYNWRNTGVQANVNQSCSLTGGTATLVLTDSTGAQVYSRNLSDNGTFQSAAGAPSAWAMRIVLTNAVGTINFRSQKKT